MTDNENIQEILYATGLVASESIGSTVVLFFQTKEEAEDWFDSFTNYVSGDND